MKLTTAVLILGALLLTTCDASLFAQKKDTKKVEHDKMKKGTDTTQTQNTIKEVLVQFVGKLTNLGVLKRVAGDYFMVDDDGTMIVHPLYTLHTIKIVKAKEGGEMKIEIKLVAKD